MGTMPLPEADSSPLGIISNSLFLAQIHKCAMKSAGISQLSLPQGRWFGKCFKNVLEMESDPFNWNARSSQDHRAAKNHNMWRPMDDRVVQQTLNSLDPTWFEEISLSLLHTDLTGDNIVWSPEGRPSFIDWEYARMGDPAEEVAYISTENQLREGLWDAIWEGYGETSVEGTKHLRERSLVWRPITALGGIWWLDRYVRSLRVRNGIEKDDAITESPEYYLRQAVVRLAYSEHRV